MERHEYLGSQGTGTGSVDVSPGINGDMSPLMPASLVALYNGMMDRTVQPTGAVSCISPGVYVLLHTSTSTFCGQTVHGTGARSEGRDDMQLCGIEA